MKSKLILAGKLLLIHFLIYSCVNSKENNDLILDIPQIISKSPEEVMRILGEPDSSEIKPIFNKKILTYYYTEHVAEVRFFNDAASEIIIRNPDKIPFEEASLAKFGIDPKPSTEKKENLLIVWENYEIFKTISFYTKYRHLDGTPRNYELFFKGKE